MQTNRLFVLGPPASGKSRAISAVRASVLVKRPDCLFLSIEDAHRALCPPDQVSSEYYYDNAGALTLLKPEEQINAALGYLRDALATDRFVICEISTRSFSAFCSFFADYLIQGSVMLWLHAATDERVHRNFARGQLKVPDHIVRDFQLLPTESELAEAGINGAHCETLEMFGNEASALSNFASRVMSFR